MPLTNIELAFVFVVFTSVGLSTLFVKNIPWNKFGLTSKPWWAGWKSILFFNAFVFVFVQLSDQIIEFPYWITDRDNIFNLIAVVAAQEIVFRSLLLTWLERWGQNKALGISTIVFASIHFVLPSHWIITMLSIVGGYFWGWHFLKYRNLYWVIFSHFFVNMSFNYQLF